MLDLSNVAPLLLPWRPDPWGRLRPPVSGKAMALSARLASDVYDMNVDAWQEAGWRDVTIQVDGDLTGIDPAPDGVFGQLSAAWKMSRIRSRLKQRNPLGQVAGAIRQRKTSSTGKALVMIHPAPPGRYVVAISFMGTGERLYDWISNLRMDSEAGSHRGYLQLTRQFEDNEPDIEFPETARELGLPRLTLLDILREACSVDSRFVLWLSGHSQGGALLQIYAHRKLHLDGVRAGNLVGYSFASPSAFSWSGVENPGAYPLYHLINTEDLVPRTGAQVHLGVCLHYAADDPLREATYTWPTDAAALRRRALLQPVLESITGPEIFLEVMIACMCELRRYDLEDVLAGMQQEQWRQPLGLMLNMADDHVDALLLRTARKLALTHRSIAGRSVNGRRVLDYRREIRRILALLGLKEFFAAWGELFGQPHRINQRGQQPMSPYAFIAQLGLDRLRAGVWYPGSAALTTTPRLLGDPCYAAPQPLIHNRRRTVPPRSIHRGLIRRDPRDDRRASRYTKE